MMRSILALVLLAVAVNAQQIGGNAPAGAAAPATFSTSSQLVVETVNVKDKNGKAIEGLTAKDFTVTEDGVEQMIRLFEFQRVPEEVTPAPPIKGFSPPLK